MNLIVAIDNNRAIGNKGGLLCHLSEDLKHFKELTTGKTVIMGINTLLSLPKSTPLPNRRNIVITHRETEIEGAEVVHSVREALEKADKDAFVIGGSSIYDALLPYCDTCYVTQIHESFEADRYFPSLEDFRLVECSALKEAGGILFDFRIYRRKNEKA